ncbi:MAG: AI-2E family transporter [Gemmatimonadaceae bacterium]|nr:AI-2E family transporter [Gemmatimonadaceae bacterium]
MDLLYSRQHRALLVIVLLGIAIVVAVAPYASGLLGATVLYVMCVPTFRRLNRLMHADLAAAITLIGALLLIAIPVGWVVFVAADQLPAVLEGAQSSDVIQRLSVLRIGNIQIGTELAKASGTFIQWISSQAFGVVGGAARATLNLVIAFFALYYMLVSATSMWEVFRRVLPFSGDTADELRARFYSVTYATLVGTTLTAVLQGTLIGVGFRLVDIPNAALWGLVTAFASVLPVLGSALVWLPGTLFLVVGERYVPAITLFAIGAVVASNIDNVIRPIVFRRVSNIHPMVTLVGAFAGISYFGVLGILLGPLAIQYFFVLLRLFREEYIDQYVTRTTEMQVPHPISDPTHPSGLGPAVQAEDPPRLG